MGDKNRPMLRILFAPSAHQSTSEIVVLFLFLLGLDLEKYP